MITFPSLKHNSISCLKSNIAFWNTCDPKPSSFPMYYDFHQQPNLACWQKTIVSLFMPIVEKLYDRPHTLTLILTLTAHNWQKWKRVFLPCPWHKIYRVEAVGLKSSNYNWKIMIFAICEIWGNFVKNWYFVNNCLIKVQIWKSFRTYVTHISVFIFRILYFVSPESIFS